ncbi:hypothetical protein BB560_004152 [Smittium megazygosporum]|uniref:CCHC-type domain-containing protein n=1 Tax=Smittium megazygosporum TaxID=133381 RepID=A0A2T9ZA15_9FUNG|nr:hypothetical protein BB560_004152 [Smittium megazygosporum]
MGMEIDPKVEINCFDLEEKYQNEIKAAVQDILNKANLDLEKKKRDLDRQHKRIERRKQSVKKREEQKTSNSKTRLLPNKLVALIEKHFKDYCESLEDSSKLENGVSIDRVFDGFDSLVGLADTEYISTCLNRFSHSVSAKLSDDSLVLFKKLPSDIQKEEQTDTIKDKRKRRDSDSANFLLDNQDEQDSARHEKVQKINNFESKPIYNKPTKMVLFGGCDFMISTLGTKSEQSDVSKEQNALNESTEKNDTYDHESSDSGEVYSSEDENDSGQDSNDDKYKYNFTKELELSKVDNVDRSNSNFLKACFNCGSVYHEIQDCPSPRNKEIISQNASKYKLQDHGKVKQRFHDAISDSNNYVQLRKKMIPGNYSSELLEALGLGKPEKKIEINLEMSLDEIGEIAIKQSKDNDVGIDNENKNKDSNKSDSSNGISSKKQIPSFIEKMYIYGYPPSYISNKEETKIEDILSEYENKLESYPILSIYDSEKPEIKVSSPTLENVGKDTPDNAEKVEDTLINQDNTVVKSDDNKETETENSLVEEESAEKEAKPKTGISIKGTGNQNVYYPIVKYPDLDTSKFIFCENDIGEVEKKLLIRDKCAKQFVGIGKPLTRNERKYDNDGYYEDSRRRYSSGGLSDEDDGYGYSRRTPSNKRSRDSYYYNDGVDWDYGDNERQERGEKHYSTNDRSRYYDQYSSRNNHGNIYEGGYNRDYNDNSYNQGGFDRRRRADYDDAGYHIRF